LNDTGWAEFAGLDIAGWKMTTEVARVEIAVLHSDRLEIGGMENDKTGKRQTGNREIDWTLASTYTLSCGLSQRRQ